jgi:hypothetical protein
MFRVGLSKESGHLSLLLSLLVLLGLLGSFSALRRGLGIRALVGLHIFVVNSKGLINLSTKSSLVLNTIKKLVAIIVGVMGKYSQADKLRIIHL